MREPFAEVVNAPVDRLNRFRLRLNLTGKDALANDRRSEFSCFMNSLLVDRRCILNIDSDHTETGAPVAQLLYDRVGM